MNKEEKLKLHLYQGALIAFVIGVISIGMFDESNHAQVFRLILYIIGIYGLFQMIAASHEEWNDQGERNPNRGCFLPSVLCLLPLGGLFVVEAITSFLNGLSVLAIVITNLVQ
jgi:hypothetical protein